MKKVLSFVLVLAMILGSFSMVFAATFSDVEAGDDHEEAINVLSSLGVVSGYTDGTFKPEKVVTRAEMAAFIINALFGEDKQITQRATNFSDVTAAHWASGFVDYANTLGIISGYTDGTFKPDQPVAYNEAITMVVKALGYTDDCLPGEYPARYVNKAKALGLLKEVDGLGTAGAVRGDIAQLVYNALTCPIGTVNKDGDWKPNYVGEYLDLDTMLARLGGYQDRTATIIDDDDIEKALVDISEYLGACAKVVRTKAGGPIVGIYSLESEAYYGKYTDDTKIGDYTIKASAWTNEDHLAVEYFVNGESGDVSSMDGKKVTAWGNFSGKYATTIYSLVMWDGEDPFMFDDDLNTKKCTLKGKDFAKNDDDEIDTDSFVLLGVDSLADIEEDNVVTLYLAPSNGQIKKVEVGTKTEEAKVSKVTKSKVYFDGEGYSIADDKVGGFDVTDLDFEETYTLYFDYSGELFAVKGEETSSTENYAILLDVYKNDSTDKWATSATEKDLKVKLFTAEGETVTYTVDEDLATSDVMTTTKTTATSLLGQLVEYTLDEDEVVTAIDTVSYVDTVAGAKISKKGVYDSKYYFEDEAVVFEVTFSYVAEDEAEIKKVSVELIDAAKLANTTLDGDSSYTVNEDGKIDYLVCGSTGSAAEKTYGFYVGEYKSANKKYVVSFIVDGEEVEFTTTEKSDIAGTTTGYEDYALLSLDVATKKVTAEVVEPTTTASAIDGNVSVKKNTVVVNEEEVTASYALDADAKVYQYDADEEELVEIKAADLASLDDETTYTIAFYMTEGAGDTTYDIVVVFETPAAE